MKKLLMSIALVTVGAGTVLAPTAAAETDTFNTTVSKDGGAYFKERPYGNAKRVYGLIPKGHRVHFHCSVVNDHGNIWYRDNNHNFIYSGNVVKPTGVPRC